MAPPRGHSLTVTKASVELTNILFALFVLMNTGNIKAAMIITLNRQTRLYYLMFTECFSIATKTGCRNNCYYLLY